LDAIARLPETARRAFAVQLRDPELPARSLLSKGIALRDRLRAMGAAIVVNDRLDLAIALGADGVHLGRRSVSVADARSIVGPGGISVACHSVDEVRRAASEGADAALLSPIFASPGKGPPIGVAAIEAARAAIEARGSALSILALGGITRENA